MAALRRGGHTLRLGGQALLALRVPAGPRRAVAAGSVRGDAVVTPGAPPPPPPTPVQALEDREDHMTAMLRKVTAKRRGQGLGEDQWYRGETKQLGRGQGAVEGRKVFGGNGGGAGSQNSTGRERVGSKNKEGQWGRGQGQLDLGELGSIPPSPRGSLVWHIPIRCVWGSGNLNPWVLQPCEGLGPKNSGMPGAWVLFPSSLPLSRVGRGHCQGQPDLASPLKEAGTTLLPGPTSQGGNSYSLLPSQTGKWNPGIWAPPTLIHSPH